MSDDIDFKALMLPVAVAIWGKPATQTKREARWGDGGGRSVDIAKGTWFDHRIERGGGVLDLVEVEKGRAKAGGEAVAWLRENGFVAAERPAGSAPPAKASKPAGGLAPAPARSSRMLVAEYDYRDADGALLYQVQRWEWEEGGKRKKTFVQRRPAPNEPGVWINGLLAGDYMRPGPGKDWWRFDEDRAGRNPDRATFGDTPHGLYRLAELREAVRDGETVFVVEGEKKVDALGKIGVTGTCNSGGGSKWHAGFADEFVGADVVIAIDNDEPGRKHGNVVAAAVSQVARRVRLLDFAQVLDRPPREKYDIADWTEEGGDAATQAAEFRSMFGAVPWREINAPGPQHEYLVDGVVTRGEVFLIVGPSQSGKSFAAIDLAFAVCRGEPWFGRDVIRGGVIYQAGESGRGVRRKRIPAYALHHSLSYEDDPLPFMLLTGPLDLYASDDPTDRFIAECRHWAATFDCPLEVVFIDTFAAATPGADENNAKDVTPILARAQRIARSLECAVCLVHHMNAGGTKPRGHTSIFANVDSVLAVEKVLDKTGAKKLDADRRPMRSITLTKAKDDEDGLAWRFVLALVQVSKKPNGDPINSCVVNLPNLGALDGVPKDEDKARLSSQAEVFLRAVYSALDAHSVPAPASLSLPPDVRVVEWKHVRTAFAAATFEGDGEDEEKRASRIKQALKRHGTSLLSRQIIGRADPYVWVTGRKVAGFAPPARTKIEPEPAPRPAESAGLVDDDLDALLNG